MRKIQIACYGIESAELPEDVEALEAQGENLEEATEALEAFALLLQPAVEGYAVNPAALEAVAAVTNRLVRKAGLPTLAVGTESLVVDTVQQAASLGLEDIKEHLKNAGKAIVDFLKKIFKVVADKINATKNWLGASADKLIKKFEELKDDIYDKKFEFVESAFHKNGKLSTDVLGDLKRSIEIYNKLELKSLNDIRNDVKKVTPGPIKLNKAAADESLRNRAKDAYREFDGLLKFDKSTHVSTVVISGQRAVVLDFVEDARNPQGMLNIETNPSLDDKKTLTLKALGLKPGDVKSLKQPMDDLLTKVRAAAAGSEEAFTDFEKAAEAISGNEDYKENMSVLRDASMLYSKICTVRYRLSDNIVNTVQALIRVADILKKDA